VRLIKLHKLLSYLYSPQSWGFSLIGVLLGVVGQWPLRQWRIEAWREQQESIARKDAEFLGEMATLLDPSKREALSQVPPRGDLQWDTQRRSSRDESSWAMEPNGFYRLRFTHPLPNAVLPLTATTMIRRYDVATVERIVGPIWPASLLFGLLGFGIGSLLQRQRLQQKQERWWLQTVATSLQQGNSILPKPSSDLVQQGLEQGVYEIANSMRDQIAMVRSAYENSSRAMTQMPIGILSFDDQLQLEFANPAGKQLLEIEKAAEGQKLIDVLRNPSVVDCVLDTSRTGMLKEVELELTTSKRWIRVKTLPLLQQENAIPITASADSTTAQSELREGFDSGTGSFPVMLTVTDETRIKQLENLRRDFTANVSHELKTPLSAIKAYAETLLMGALEDPEASRRFIDRISEQSARLDNLIRDLLQLTRLQSQPEKPRLTRLQIVDVLQAAIDDHRPIAKSKSVTLDFEVVQSCEVLSDLESVQTVLNNLLSNAIRYNKPNGFVSIRLDRVNSNRCTVQITDTGIGIPPQDIDRIFERFYRVEKARSQDLGGTGLGLAIVKHICQSIQATITVRSRLGEGSCFELSLPMAREGGSGVESRHL
jgi:two-component system phosphate regulon sensor histidine kinase PhoR